MAEYIEREALLANLKRQYGEDLGWQCTVNMSDVGMMIEDAPAADVVEVVHGEWEPVLEGVWNLPTPVLVGWRCSQCGRTEQEKEPYCNCGAKMDGGKHETD